MMPHPPELAEDLVGWFLPPACREEVLGDLWESCKNPVQYTISALAVVPRVVVSQIRRNTDVWIFLLTTCGVCYSVAAGVFNLSLEGDPNGILRLAIPVVPAVLILLIRNGFASLEDRRRRSSSAAKPLRISRIRTAGTTGIARRSKAPGSPSTDGLTTPAATE